MKRRDFIAAAAVLFPSLAIFKPKPAKVVIGVDHGAPEGDTIGYWASKTPIEAMIHCLEHWLPDWHWQVQLRNPSESHDTYGIVGHKGRHAIVHTVDFGFMSHPKRRLALARQCQVQARRLESYAAGRTTGKPCLTWPCSKDLV